MESFKKYIGFITLGVSIIVLIAFFIPAVSFRYFGNEDHQVLGIFAAFGYRGDDFNFSFNFSILIAFLLPLLAGPLHYISKKSSQARIYQFISIALFLAGSILLFAVPLLFSNSNIEIVTSLGLIELNNFTTNYGFGAIFAGVFSALAALASLFSLLITE